VQELQQRPEFRIADVAAVVTDQQDDVVRVRFVQCVHGFREANLTEH
jgi:hypothetical protein